MINVLIDFITVLFLLIIVMFFVIRWPRFGNIIFLAFGVRFAALAFHTYVSPIPDSDGDALGFEMLAWEWGQNGFFDAVGNFPGLNTYFISWPISLLYSLSGQNALIAGALSTAVSMSAVIASLLLVKKLFGMECALRVGWIVSLFPTLILYSALPLREAYVSFFLIVALHGVVDWSRQPAFKSFLLANFGFTLAGFYHGPLIVGALTFCFLVGFQVISQSVKSVVIGRLALMQILVALLAGTGILFYAFGFFTLPKLGTFQQATDLQILLTKIRESNTGSNGNLGAAYPSFLIVNAPFELIYKLPLRMLYFLFSPFPWDLREAKHSIGLVDGCLYLALVFCIGKQWKVMLSDNALRSIIYILLVLLIVFGVGVGNFGTGLRHRSKFVLALIALAAPAIPKLVFKKKLIKPPSGF